MAYLRPPIKSVIFLMLFLSLYAGGAYSIGTWNPLLWNKIRIDSITVTGNWQEWGYLRKNRSVDGNLLSIGKTIYSRGLGTHAYSEITLGFDKKFSTFSGVCGIDSETGGKGSAVFKIYAGSKLLFESPLMRGGSPAVVFHVPVNGIEELRLVSENVDGRHFDHADWVGLSLK